MDNPKITVEQLRQMRSRIMSEAMEDCGEILVAHDVTLLDYSGHKVKDDRRKIGDHRGLGYEYFPALALERFSGRVLGVLHDSLTNLDGPDDAESCDYGYEPALGELYKSEGQRLCENHRHQLAVHILKTAPMLEEKTVTHVADREFDDVFDIDVCRKVGHHVVLRSSGLRNIQVPAQAWILPEAVTKGQGGHPGKEGWVYVNMKKLLPGVPCAPYKELPLDARGRVCSEEESVRRARLTIGGFPAFFYRAAKRNKKYVKTPNPVEVNIVVIREIDAPPKATPLLWVLITDLPADSYGNLIEVGRAYELRWAIEEYFKLLKSGYQIEKTKLNSGEKISKLLVVLSLAAVTVFNLKRALELPAGGRLKKSDYERIRKAMREPNNPEIQFDLRLFAQVAKMGGWLGRPRDPIGSQVLMRGILMFYAALDLVQDAPGILQHAALNPFALRLIYAYK
jgi:hypothetical protein